MAYLVGKLTALKVTRETKPGLYCDGGGLYLQVSGEGGCRKSWVFCFRFGGRDRAMGLGSLKTFGLADARERALECRRKVHDGIDPIEERRAKKTAAVLANAKTVTFKQCAEKYIAAHKPAWRNAKHAAQWSSTLKTYADPVIGNLSVRSIDTSLVIKILEPIWSTKAETAGRVRGRIEVILDWATVRGYRTGENPARWRGHLDKLLPPRSKVRRIKHHAALPYGEMFDFMTKLRKQDGVAARALEFLILTAARTGEVIGARYDEIIGAVWIVPGDRMKVGREHRIPLSNPALAVVSKMKREFGGEYIFPGGDQKKPLSNMAMLALLDRMKRDDLTAHGFRSTFRDWASEYTNHPPDVVEMALAHTINNKVEAAYRRGDLFNKRMALMSDWAEFCGQKSAQSATTLRECVG